MDDRRQVMNGKPQEAVAEVLTDEVSVGYKPTIPLETMWQLGGDMPTVTLRRDIEFMLLHPIVSISLEYYKSGIAGAEFWGGPDFANPSNKEGKPISPDPKVAQFVLAHAERFWQLGMPLMQEGGYSYGWAPGEHIYDESNGYMTWSHLKAFHPSDGFILTLNHQPVGIRVKNIRDVPDMERGDGARDAQVRHTTGGRVDLWFASDTVPAKAAWYPHRAKYNQFYGRTQLAGAWRPWRRLGWRDGVEQVIDAAIYRAGYKGPIVRHPMEDMQTAKSGIPATVADARGGLRRSAQDVARQMIEWGKAGAGFTMSSAQYPPTQGGGPKWDIDWPDHVMDVRPLVDAARYLEDQIMLGMGVPPELIKAGGTGSGYSGRSIPREAFLCGQQHVADAMLQIFVEQVLRPLVLWNFGDMPFDVQCKPLLQSQAESAGGSEGPQPAQEAKPPQTEQPTPTVAPPAGAVQSPVLSMDQQQKDKILDIVRRVLKKSA
jgi:hypothetical protein